MAGVWSGDASCGRGKLRSGRQPEDVARDAGKRRVFRYRHSRLCGAAASLLLERQHAVANDAEEEVMVI